MNSSPSFIPGVSPWEQSSNVLMDADGCNSWTRSIQTRLSLNSNKPWPSTNLLGAPGHVEDSGAQPQGYDMDRKTLGPVMLSSALLPLRQWKWQHCPGVARVP